MDEESDPAGSRWRPTRKRRILLVAGFVLLATTALGVQAAVIDRDPVVRQGQGGDAYPGNTLVGLHSWDNSGGVVEITPEGEVVWEYGVRNGDVEAARFFGTDPLEAGDAAPNVTPENDGDVVLFTYGEVVPASECPAEHLRYDASFSGRLDPGDHCVRNHVVLVDRGPDRDAREVVWEYEWYDGMIHWHEVHDAVVTEDGEVAIIDMGENRVFTVDETGEITWEWHAEDHIGQGTEFFEKHVEGSPHVDDPAEYAKGDEWDDWTHWNDIDETDNGTFWLSVRNYDMLIEVDPETDEVVDTVGQPGNHSLMHHQHNPQHLGEHDVVVVADSENNRVIEVDRDTEEIRWSYNGPQGDPLQWPRDADRLPNGNTLVTDSRNNRVLEIDRRGEVVWQFEDPSGEVLPLPYAAERLPAGEDAGGPPASELGDGVEKDHGIREDVHSARTHAYWILPAWMQLPQQLTLLAVLFGCLWLFGEGVLYGVGRLADEAD